MTTDAHATDEVRATLNTHDDGWVTLALPHSDYEVRLRLDGDISTPVGKRVRGAVHATALRIHPAHGGGRFIEPVSGEPRIVAGAVRAVDADAGRMLVDVAIPVWLTCPVDQDYAGIDVGQLVNCYVHDATFTPGTAAS